MEMEEQFKKVKLEDREDSSGKRNSDSKEELDGEEKKEKKKKRNRKPLSNFVRACDRFGISDQAGAFVGFSLLMDYGIITKEDTTQLIDPTKLRRQRQRLGKIIASKRKDLASSLAGLYTDGKRSPTLVRETKVKKVSQGRGAGAPPEQ